MTNGKPPYAEVKYSIWNMKVKALRKNGYDISSEDTEMRVKIEPYPVFIEVKHPSLQEEGKNGQYKLAGIYNDHPIYTRLKDNESGNVFYMYYDSGSFKWILNRDTTFPEYPVGGASVELGPAINDMLNR